MDNLVNKPLMHTRKLPTMVSVFQVIQMMAPIDRMAIQKETGLSWASVSQMAGVLVNSGVATQNLYVNGLAGKNSKLLDFSKDDNLLIGIHMNFDKVMTLVSTIRGEVLSQFVTPVKAVSSLLDEVILSMEKAVSLHSGKKILAAGISFPGSVDIENHKICQSVYFPGIRDIDMYEMLKEKFSFPVFTFHDSDCFLIAEKYLGVIARQHLTNAVVINAAQGVSMSMMVNSHIFVSTGTNQGEIGHIPVVENGDICLCGKRGCLDMYASSRGIAYQHAKQKHDEPLSDFNEIGLQALNGDQECIRLFEEAGRYLGKVIGYVATVLEPEIIIFCGNHIKYLRIFEKMLRASFRSTVYSNNTTQLIYSDLGNNAQAVGAALYAFEKIRDDFLAALLDDM